MGNFLTSPQTAKTSSSGSSRRFLYATSAMQGWRESMEDAHTCELDIMRDGVNEFGFFAVFDGHGGSTVATCSSSRLHHAVMKEPTFSEKNYKEAMRHGYLTLDSTLRTLEEVEQEPCGCTAVSALITDTQIFLANAGDSRAVLSTNRSVVPLSADHKPYLDVELNRIEAAGGYIQCGRVNGNLALSRALGDYEFKNRDDLPAEEQAVTANPDVSVYSITENDEFLLIACDGIWDCVSNEKSIEYIRYKLASGMNLVEICEALMDACLAPDTSNENGIGCDNMTVVIVALLNGRTEEEWYNWMRGMYAELLGGETPIKCRRSSTDTVPDESRSIFANFMANQQSMQGQNMPAGLGSFFQRAHEHAQLFLQDHMTKETDDQKDQKLQNGTPQVTTLLDSENEDVEMETSTSNLKTSDIEMSGSTEDYDNINDNNFDNDNESNDDHNGDHNYNNHDDVIIAAKQKENPEDFKKTKKCLQDSCLDEQENGDVSDDTDAFADINSKSRSAIKSGSAANQAQNKLTKSQLSGSKKTTLKDAKICSQGAPRHSPVKKDNIESDEVVVASLGELPPGQITTANAVAEEFSAEEAN